MYATLKQDYDGWFELLPTMIKAGTRVQVAGFITDGRIPPNEFIAQRRVWLIAVVVDPTSNRFIPVPAELLEGIHD